jgi:transposase
MGAALAPKQERRAETPRREHFPLEEHAEQILALMAEQPDLTLMKSVAALRRRRIRTSRSALWRFLDRHGITLKKSMLAAERQRADVAPATPTLDTRARYA